ncbi:hypothetical protein E9993_16950 [Labilibacter sediminis]|nr:hypothetical protein E9993_16950 [Labilibacter sediminis]
MKELSELLREYINKVEEIKPEISWGSYDTLIDRMKVVANKIEQDIKNCSNTYNLDNFYFSDFNGKSPQGEIWEYLNGIYPVLKIIGDNIRNKFTELYNCAND